MLVASAGTGKTVLMNDKLTSLPETYMIANVPFNFYTTSMMLQVCWGVAEIGQFTKNNANGEDLIH